VRKDKAKAEESRHAEIAALEAEQKKDDRARHASRDGLVETPPKLPKYDMRDERKRYTGLRGAERDECVDGPDDDLALTAAPRRRSVAKKHFEAAVTFPEDSDAGELLQDENIRTEPARTFRRDIIVEKFGHARLLYAAPKRWAAEQPTAYPFRHRKAGGDNGAEAAWREAVFRRAGGGCQAKDVIAVTRCQSPATRVDHIVAVTSKDGGVEYDPNNGHALCELHYRHAHLAREVRKATLRVRKEHRSRKVNFSPSKALEAEQFRDVARKAKRAQKKLVVWEYGTYTVHKAKRLDPAKHQAANAAYQSKHRAKKKTRANGSMSLSHKDTRTREQHTTHARLFYKYQSRADRKALAHVEAKYGCRPNTDPGMIETIVHQIWDFERKQRFAAVVQPSTGTARQQYSGTGSTGRYVVSSDPRAMEQWGGNTGMRFPIRRDMDDNGNDGTQDASHLGAARRRGAVGCRGE
jgi:hypothetical protein